MTQLVLTAASWLNLDGIAALLRDWKRARARKAMYRQTRKELNNLTNRDLHDLGISSSDIESIASGTFHDDRITNVKTNPNLKGFV